MLNAKIKLNAKNKNKTSTKKHRKMLRGEKEKKDDKHVDTEGGSYEPGGFN